jgi:hypothetical protein
MNGLDFLSALPENEQNGIEFIIIKGGSHG